MLQTIRDRAQGWIAWVIVIFISIPFALWGINEYLGVGGEPVVAEVDGVEITQRQLENSVNRYRANLREQFGGRIPDMFSDEMLRAQVLNTMVQEQLLALHTAKSGLRAGDNMVIAEIRNIPSFQKDGKFDTEEYRRMLGLRGQSERNFEEQMRQSLATALFSNGISESALVSDAEINEYVRLRNQKRTLAYITVEANRFADQAIISDEAIQAYYADNSEQFRAPERVKVEYLEINADTVAGSVPVNEAAVQAYYEANKSDYTAEEKRAMRHILIAVSGDVSDSDARAKAEKLLADLNAGADFAALASENSDDPGSAASGGDLGVVERGIMVKPFEDAAFSLNAGETSGLVRTRFGYHIIQVTAVEGGEIRPLEEVRAEIERSLREDGVKEVLFDKIERIAELAYETPDTLQPVSEALGIGLQEEWVERTGSSGKLETPAVIESAFSEDVLERGYNSEPIELGNPEHVVVIRVVEHQESMPKALDEVKGEIGDILKAEAMAELAGDKADGIMASLTPDSVFADVATAESLRIDGPAETKRIDSNFPPLVVAEAFRLPVPEEGKASYGRVSMPTGNQVIVAVTSVADGDAASLSEADRAALAERLSAARGNAEFSGFVAWLRETGDVVIKKKESN